MAYKKTIFFNTEEERDNFSKRIDRVKPDLILPLEEEELET